MGRKDKDTRREELEREAERELQQLTRQAGPGGGGPANFPGGAPPMGPGPGGMGVGAPLSPIEQMAQKVRNREVGREVRGGPRGRPSAPAPPVEMFSGPVGSGLTPGFGPGKRAQVPPAFQESPPSPFGGYDDEPGDYDSGYSGYSDDDFDEDEEISVTEIAVTDYAARHGINPEDAMVTYDPASAEEMRDRAMQQYVQRRDGGAPPPAGVTDPFAPAGMRNRRPGAPSAASGIRTRYTQAQGEPVGALARLRERRRQEEEARRREQEQSGSTDMGDEPPAPAAYGSAPPPEEPLAAGYSDAAGDYDSTDGESEESDDDQDQYTDEAGVDAVDDEAEEAARDSGDRRYRGGALQRLLAERAKAARQAAAGSPPADADAGDSEDGWSGGAPGRLHARERLQARTVAQEEVDAESSAPVSPPISARRGAAKRGSGQKKTANTEAASANAPARSARVTDLAAVRKGANRVPTEKEAAAKTPAAKRSKSIKATAEKSGSRSAASAKKAPAKKASAATKSAVKKASAATKSAVKKAAKSSAKKAGAASKTAEKALGSKTPAAKRARSIKATAKKS